MLHQILKIRSMNYNAEVKKTRAKYHQHSTTQKDSGAAVSLPQLQTHLKTPNTLKVNRKSGSLSGFIAQKLLNHMPHSVLHIHAPPG